jgi:hypothetical protein
MPYTSYYSQGVKFIKIARIDDQGKDNTLSLQELNSIRIDYSDTGIIEYPITSIAKYDTYFLFGVATTNITSSTDNYILNYRASGSSRTTIGGGQDDITLINYTESYDNLGYFNTSSGQYILGNLTNIPIQFITSASVTGSASGNVNIQIYSSINGSVASQTKALGSSPYQQILSASYSGVAQEGEQFYVSVTNQSTASILITGSFYVTQSVPPTASISDLVVLQPYLDENFYVSEYNVLAGNAVIPRYSALYMDVDYTTNTIRPSNLASIISGSATRAAVQDSNYTDTGWINARYNGTKVSSIDYNTYTPATEYTGSKGYYSFTTQQVTFISDTSIFGYTGSWPGDQSYGKQTSIDIYSNYFAKFINITSSSPEILGGSNVYITELIDINGNRLSLSENQYLLDVAYNFFKGTEVNIYNFSAVTGSGLVASATVFDAGAYYQTILSFRGNFGPYPSNPTFIPYIWYNGSLEYPLLGGYTPTSQTTLGFALSSSNTLVTFNSDDSYSNWLSPFLQSYYVPTSGSVTKAPFARVDVAQSASIYNKNTNTIITGSSTATGSVLWQDLISPIKANDYIRLSTSASYSSLFNPSSSTTYQIIDTYTPVISGGYYYSGSLILNGTVSNLGSIYSQSYIIYRRIPSENYVVINKTITLDNEGLLIPANFNPDYDPIAIARRAGVI